jgi:hypothetical protein
MIYNLCGYPLVFFCFLSNKQIKSSKKHKKHQKNGKNRDFRENPKKHEKHRFSPRGGGGVKNTKKAQNSPPSALQSAGGGVYQSVFCPSPRTWA